MPAFIEPKTSYSFFGVQFVVETMGKDCFYKKQPVLNERATTALSFKNELNA